MRTIFVVSDGTGRTADQALKAALTQFSNVEVEIVRKSGVRDENKIRRVVMEASQVGGFILHTLVSNALRRAMLQYGRESNVETIDLMGPLLARLSSQFAISPAEKPGLFGQLNEDYFRRIETMEFAFHHDDGQRIHEASKAEIVLLGVSRTFKTPLSIYLAFKGWFVANIPVIPGTPLPGVLAQLPSGTVFCLDTSPRQLTDLRRARAAYLNRSLGEYTDIDFVKLELMHARKLFSEHPDWPVIHVANKPIEEIASEILALKAKTQKHNPTAPGQGGPPDSHTT
ncbi:MAG: pyruvate, water dikinase regulatory protein [Acidobacteriota bacterium]